MKRNSYGQIMNPDFDANQYERDLHSEAWCLINAAAKKRKIKIASDSITFDRKGRADGYATHHEIYDISPDARHVLVCVRDAEGTRYGVKTTLKNYYIVSAHGKLGTHVQPAPKSKAAKASKQASDYGHAIEVCIGKAKLRGPAKVETRCYKIVADTLDGYKSVYDGSPWNIREKRTERATMNHEGGYYVFPTVETAITAWENRIAFSGDWLEYEKYAILECECAGRHYRHDNSKICVTNVTPISKVKNL